MMTLTTSSRPTNVSARNAVRRWSLRADTPVGPYMARGDGRWGRRRYARHSSFIIHHSSFVVRPRFTFYLLPFTFYLRPNGSLSQLALAMAWNADMDGHGVGVLARRYGI
jgi:hypothetical protein